jgi:hypothetical protein
MYINVCPIDFTNKKSKTKNSIFDSANAKEKTIYIMQQKK